MERLNQWISLIANIGVIAGIVFLAFEIRVNTNAVRTESATSYIANWTASSTATAMDPEMVAILQKVNTDGWEAVSPEQLGRTMMFASSQFKSAEYAHFQWLEGNLDDRLWAGNDRGTYLFLWNNSWMREGWQRGLRYSYTTEFREYIDTMIEDICSRRECRALPPFATTSEAIKGLEAWSARN